MDRLLLSPCSSQAQLVNFVVEVRNESCVSVIATINEPRDKAELYYAYRRCQKECKQRESQDFLKFFAKKIFCRRRKHHSSNSVVFGFRLEKLVGTPARNTSADFDVSSRCRQRTNITVLHGIQVRSLKKDLDLRK